MNASDTPQPQRWRERLWRLRGSQLRRNAASGLVVTVLGFAVTAVTYPLYLHYLGYEQYGLWLVLTTVLTLAQFGNLGIGPAVSKLVAEHYERRDYAAVGRYVTSAMFILIVSGAVILLLVLLLRGPIVAAFKLKPRNAALVLDLLPQVGFLSLYVFLVRATGATLAGLGRLDLVNYGRIGARIIGVAVSALLLAAGHGVTSLLIAYYISEGMSHLFYGAAIVRRVPLSVLHPRSVSRQATGRLVRFGSHVVGGTALDMLAGPFNKLMISRCAGIEAVPLYEIAYNASMYVRGLGVAGLESLMPEVGRFSGPGEEARNRVRILYGKSVRLALCMGIPLFIAFFCGADLLLRTWLRSQFVPMLVPTFRIMLGAAFLSLVAVPAYYVLLGLERPECIFKSSALQTGTNVLAVSALLMLGWRVSAETVVWCCLAAVAISSTYLLTRLQMVLGRQTAPATGADRGQGQEVVGHFGGESDV